MLQRMRFEVEAMKPEPDSARRVLDQLDALELATMRHEAAAHGYTFEAVCEEAERHLAQGAKHPWVGYDERGFLESLLGYQRTDEHVEYRANLPGHVGRRVAALTRADTRSNIIERPAIPLPGTHDGEWERPEPEPA